jgi:DNA-binding SARP family transcriptional activator
MTIGQVRDPVAPSTGVRTVGGTSTINAARVMFRLLGPVQVTTDSGDLPLASAMVRAVLAVLMMSNGRYVSMASMIRALWDNPPKSAESNIRSYIAQLRAVLRTAHPSLGPRLVARRGSGEYLLALHAHELDLRQFDELTRRGQAQLLVDDHAGAAGSLSEALALWQGFAGQDVTGLVTGSLHDKLEFLDERRLTATEDYIDARIALGEASTVTQEVRTMALEQPLRERSWEQLVRVLYLCGDPAGALDAFHRARRQFSERLGIDPSPRLQEMHRAVLQRDDLRIRSSNRNGRRARQAG